MTLGAALRLDDVVGLALASTLGCAGSGLRFLRGLVRGALRGGEIAGIPGGRAPSNSLSRGALLGTRRLNRWRDLDLDRLAAAIRL